MIPREPVELPPDATPEEKARLINGEGGDAEYQRILADVLAHPTRIWGTVGGVPVQSKIDPIRWDRPLEERMQAFMADMGITDRRRAYPFVRDRPFDIDAPDFSEEPPPPPDETIPSR